MDPQLLALADFDRFAGPALSQRSIINIEGPDVRQGNFDANLTAFGTKRPREPDSTLSSRDVSIDSESEEGLATQSAATAKQKKPRASLKAVRVDSLDTYWFQMFEALTQDGMKSVLRAWIQKCHPSKQTSNPYRGRKQAEALPHADAYHQRLNPGYHTAPEYWPTQEQWYDEDKLACRHLEPYHVLKKGKHKPASTSHTIDVDSLRRTTSPSETSSSYRSQEGGPVQLQSRETEASHRAHP